MKTFNFLIIFFYLITFNNILKADISISLKDYLKSQNIEKTSTQIYLLNRCSALYTYVSAIILKTDSSNSKKFIEIANSLLFKSIELRIIDNEQKLENARDKAETERENLFKSYTKDGTKNWDKNNSYFKGSYISEDISICEKLVKDN